MDFGNLNLEKVLVLDPVVDLERQPKEVVYKSGQNVSLFPYSADTVSQSNLIFNNLTPPSLSTIVRRNLDINYQLLVEVDFSIANASNASVINGNVGVYPVYTTSTDPTVIYGSSNIGLINLCPKSLPLQACASAINLSLNGQTTTLQSNDISPILAALYTDDERKKVSSVEPVMPDNQLLYGAIQQVKTSNNTLINFNNNVGLFDAYNPLSPKGYNSNTPTRQMVARQVKEATQITADGTNTYFYTAYAYNITETLMLSPTLWGDEKYLEGFTNINNITLNMVFNDLARAVSVGTAPGCTITGVRCSLNGVIPPFTVAGSPVGPITSSFGPEKPNLMLTYITQDPILEAQAPSKQVLNYEFLQPYITPLNVDFYTSYKTEDFYAQSLRLSTIPEKIFLYATPSKTNFTSSVKNATIGQVFLTIRNLKITYGNKITLLSNYTTFQLYEMTVRNRGYHGSYLEWLNGGCIVCVDVARDLGLDSQECASQPNNYATLQISGQVSNECVKSSYSNYDNSDTPANGKIAFDFYITPVFTGKAVITKSSCQFLLTGPSGPEVLELTSNIENNSAIVQDAETASQGGSLLAKGGRIVKGWLHKGRRGAGMGAGMGGSVAGGAVAGGSMSDAASQLYVGKGMKSKSRVY